MNKQRAFKEQTSLQKFLFPFIGVFDDEFSATGRQHRHYFNASSLSVFIVLTVNSAPERVLLIAMLTFDWQHFEARLCSFHTFVGS